MASPVAFKMTGHRELLRKLEGLDRKHRKSATTKALRAGAKVMVKALRTAAPRRTGAARRALGSKIRSYGDGRRAVAVSGERVERRRSGRERQSKSKWGGPHLHLIERGTKERFHTGQRSAERRLRTLQQIQQSPFAYGQDFAARIAKARQDIALGKARSRAARGLLGGGVLGLGRGLALRLRGRRSTGRVPARPFWKRAVAAAAPAVHAAQAAVLGREIEAAARSA